VRTARCLVLLWLAGSQRRGMWVLGSRSRGRLGAVWERDWLSPLSTVSRLAARHASCMREHPCVFSYWTFATWRPADLHRPASRSPPLQSQPAPASGSRPLLAGRGLRRPGFFAFSRGQSQSALFCASSVTTVTLCVLCPSPFPRPPLALILPCPFPCHPCLLAA